MKNSGGVTCVIVYETKTKGKETVTVSGCVTCYVVYCMSTFAIKKKRKTEIERRKGKRLHSG